MALTLTLSAARATPKPQPAKKTAEPAETFEAIRVRVMHKNGAEVHPSSIRAKRRVGVRGS